MISRARLLLPLSCVALASIAHSAVGQEQKTEYVSTAERNVLVEQPLPGVEGKYVSINHFKVPPGWVGGKHYHSGPAYVYVLKGTFTVEEEGKPVQTFQTGELYVEPIGNLMQAFNKSGDEPFELLVVQVQNEGEPLMYQAD